MDEEQDSSFKQMESPTYNARDCAIKLDNNGKNYATCSFDSGSAAKPSDTRAFVFLINLWQVKSTLQRTLHFVLTILADYHRGKTSPVQKNNRLFFSF